jgi:glucan biosynthesis protein C
LAASTGSLSPESTSTSPARMLYIDNMRVLLISLVIVGHMAITYGAPLGNWYYREAGEAGPLFAIATMLLLGIGASFLLGLFFFIAGYFTPRPYDRRGASRFIRDRLVRLGTPLILYAVIINPLVTYWAAAAGGYQGSLPAYVSTHLPALTKASIGPLWFVEALLLFSIVYALIRMGSGSLTGAGASQPGVPFPGNRSIILFALGLGLVTFVVRVWAPFGWWWEPIHQEPAHFPQYIALFSAGILAYRHNWIVKIPKTQARIWGWVSLALVPGLPVLAVAAGALRGEFDPAVAGGLTWLSLAYSVWEAFIGVALVIAVLVWFRDRLDVQGKLAGAMSRTAYAVYVLHPLVIIPLAIALRDVPFSLEMKFILFAPLAVAVSFMLGYLVRMMPGVRYVL